MIWRALYTLVLVVLLAILRIFSLPGTKLRQLVWARRKLSTRIAAFRSSVPGELWWFHVASAGELEQAIPLMENVRKQFPESVLFLSFFSPSAEQAAKTEAKRRQAQNLDLPWDYADYLCWDLPWTSRRYVQVLAPDYFVSMHAELWPVLFRELTRRHIPICLGAMYLPNAASLPWYRRWYLKLGLSSVNKVATVDVQTAYALQNLLPQKDVQTLGDPRIDRVLERAARNPLAKAARPQHAPEVVLASLHEADFKALEIWFKRLADSAPARVWVVPHEPKPEVVSQMQQQLRQWGVSACVASVSKDLPVIIVDSVGQLAELYSRASVAFIGGSFDRAVHNVLEPAAYGVAIVAGPKVENSCEAMEMAGSGALVLTHSPENLAEQLEALLGNELYRTQLGERARSYLRERQGVGGRYGEWLEELVKAPSSQST